MKAPAFPRPENLLVSTRDHLKAARGDLHLFWHGVLPVLGIAALAYPLLKAACAFLDEMASFESAGVSNRA